MLVNKAALEKAKQKLPDDKSWTWDDWIDLAKQISATGSGVTGAEYNLQPRLAADLRRPSAARSSTTATRSVCRPRR